MTQPTLFDSALRPAPTVPYQRKSQTSRAAAVAAGAFATTQQERVYRWWVSRGPHGATMAEAELAMVARRSSLCGRVHALAGASDGRLVKTKDIRNRCHVYVAKGHLREYLRMKVG